jgi:hypothetical protein
MKLNIDLYWANGLSVYIIITIYTGTFLILFLFHAGLKQFSTLQL